MVLEDVGGYSRIVVLDIGGPLWGGEMVFERGREEWVFLMEEDCENL
jgi:hypothetical protein